MPLSMGTQIVLGAAVLLSFLLGAGLTMFFTRKKFTVIEEDTEALRRKLARREQEIEQLRRKLQQSSGNEREAQLKTQLEAVRIQLQERELTFRDAEQEYLNRLTLAEREIRKLQGEPLEAFDPNAAYPAPDSHAGFNPFAPGAPATPPAGPPPDPEDFPQYGFEQEPYETERPWATPENFEYEYADAPPEQTLDLDDISSPIDGLDLSNDAPASFGHAFDWPQNEEPVSASPLAEDPDWWSEAPTFEAPPPRSHADEGDEWESMTARNAMPEPKEPAMPRHRNPAPPPAKREDASASRPEKRSRKRPAFAPLGALLNVFGDDSEPAKPPAALSGDGAFSKASSPLMPDPFGTTPGGDSGLSPDVADFDPFEIHPFAARPAQPSAARGPEGDDLTLIEGISPALMNRLYRAGVTTFDQIARWSRSDMRRYGELLGMGTQIFEQNWILQAQNFLFEQHN